MDNVVTSTWVFDGKGNIDEQLLEKMERWEELEEMTKG